MLKMLRRAEWSQEAVDFSLRVAPFTLHVVIGTGVKGKGQVHHHVSNHTWYSV